MTTGIFWHESKVLSLLLDLDVLPLEKKSQLEVWKGQQDYWKSSKIVASSKFIQLHPEYFNNEAQSIDRID